MTREEILCALDKLQNAQGAMRTVNNPRMNAELCLVSLCEDAAGDSFASLRARLSRLEEEGKLDNTLIVIAGDHYPYYLEDDAARQILGTLPEYTFERYHSACIIWSGAIKEPIVCDVPCCNVDILPTVLNLLGIDYDSRMLSGADVFSDALHAAVLSNRSFVTDAVKYNAVSGAYSPVGDGAAPDGEDLDAYVERVKSEVKARYAAALAINNTDFYRFVWERSGLMP